MNILVRLGRERKCFASLDQKGSFWLMTFGTLQRPENDVEIEFTQMQLDKLRDMLNQEEYKKLVHVGQC